MHGTPLMSLQSQPRFYMLLTVGTLWLVRKAQILLILDVGTLWLVRKASKVPQMLTSTNTLA